MTPTEAAAASRPRIEGDREQEILAATLDVLADVGYDRLTMDAVATARTGVQGDALPPLERQGQPDHRRAALPEGAAGRPRHRHACAATCSRRSAAWAA